MKQARFERLSIRTTLAIGFSITLGLWFYTDAAFALRIESLRRDAADIATHHMNAQESLSTVRTMVLLSSVRVRDALLDPTPDNLFENKFNIEAAHRLIKEAIEEMNRCSVALLRRISWGGCPQPSSSFMRHRWTSLRRPHTRNPLKFEMY